MKIAILEIIQRCCTNRKR